MIAVEDPNRLAMTACNFSETLEEISALDKTEILRINANKRLDPKRKTSLGQFYTPAPICRFMASLFNTIEGEVSLLDPGCGVGSLTAAFCSEAAQRANVKK